MKTTYTLSQLDEVAKQIIAESKSKVLLFYGEMGNGKTTLIKALCKALGVSDPVTSPTFSIVNEYLGTQNTLLYHFDCYRIEEEEEILDIGFDQYLENGDWIFIEWPQKIKNLLPTNSQEIKISNLNINSRSIEMLS